MESFTGSYAKTPFWIGEAHDFDGPGGWERINPVLSAVEFPGEFEGTLVRMYRDGCIEVHVPHLEQHFIAAKEKDRWSFDALTKGWAEYAKHLNILFLCLEMACLKLQNEAVLSHSELTRPDLFRARYVNGNANPSHNICVDSHVGAYQMGRYQGHYKQDIPPSFDIRISMRRFRVVQLASCRFAFRCYCEIRKQPELFQNTASLSKALSEYQSGNLATSIVLCWFILERCLNERFVAYLDSKKETVDKKNRINSKRREFLTSSHFTAAVISNLLELADLITIDELQSTDEVRKLRNNIAHNLKGDEITVERCIQVLQFTTQFLLGKMIDQPKLNLGLSAMGA